MRRRTGGIPTNRQDFEQDTRAIATAEIEKAIEQREQALNMWVKWLLIAGGIIIWGIIAAFTWTDVSKLFGLEWAKPIFVQLFWLVTIVLLIIVFWFTFALDWFNKSRMANTRTIHIVRPENQLPKIREWATKNFDVELRQCIRMGRSPQDGELSAQPHTIHFLFEKYYRGKFDGYAWVDNLLFQDPNVFHLREYEALKRDTASSHWHGEPKPDRYRAPESNSLITPNTRVVSDEGDEDSAK